MIRIVQFIAVMLGGLLMAAQLFAAGPTERNGVYLAPGWGKLSFDAPAAGSYELPPLGTAHGGPLLDTQGNTIELGELLGDKVSLLSFVYRTCDDINGCPLSTMVLYSVANRLAGQPELQDKLRLMTISFDPEGDTPEAMAEYEESILGDAELDWHFLTSASSQQIEPVLDAYQQSVIADPKSESGTGKFSHILRVYLIDEEKRIRNIYNLSFLHPDILVNDIKTLLMESGDTGVAQQ